MKELVMQLQGKSVREFAQKIINGNYRIEKQSLNRYRVYAGPGDDYTLINRRSFVLLDKELYKLQARENPLAFAIEKSLDDDTLEFTVRKSAIDSMPVKLIARTLSFSKVNLENVTTYLDNYIIKLSLVESVSERALTDKEQAIATMFQRANDNAGNPEKQETPALPAPETAQAVDTTAKEVIPEK